MPSIRFSAPAEVFDYNAEKTPEGDTPVVETREILESLDGLEHDEVFSDYLYDSSGQNILVNAGISGGLLQFWFDQKTNRLMGSTEYSLQRQLSKTEIDLLKEYTIGQWSDGIGSNFFQLRMDFGLSPQMFILNENSVIVEQVG